MPENNSDIDDQSNMPDEHKILVSHKKVIAPDAQAAPAPPAEPAAPKEPAAEEAGEPEIINELAQQAADRKQANEVSKAQEAEKQKIDKLVEDKTYFVPIGQVSKRRNLRTLVVVGIVFLVVLLGLAVLIV